MPRIIAQRIFARASKLSFVEHWILGCLSYKLTSKISLLAHFASVSLVRHRLIGSLQCKKYCLRLISIESLYQHISYKHSRIMSTLDLDYANNKLPSQLS